MLNMFLELLKWCCGFSYPKHSIMLKSKSKIIAKTVHFEMTSSVQTYCWFDDVQQTRMWPFAL